MSEKLEWIQQQILKRETSIDFRRTFHTERPYSIIRLAIARAADDLLEGFLVTVNIFYFVTFCHNN